MATVMGRRRRTKGEGKSEGELHNTEKKQKQVVLHYSVCEESVDDNDKIHRGFFRKKVLCEGKIKELEVNSVVLESSDSIAALYQRDMALFLGGGALEVYCVDEQYVVLQDIKYTLNGWYSSLLKQINEKDWQKCIEMHLKKFLKGFVKSLIKLYPNHCHGNLKNGIAVIENGEGRIYNIKYPGNKCFLEELERLANMMDFILSRSPLESLGSIDEFLPNVSKSKWFEHYQRCSFEFCNFMVQIRLIIQKKVEFFAPLYPTFLWLPEERYQFMEDIHDLFWNEQRTKFVNHFTRYFRKGWRWWDNIPPAGGFTEVYYHGGDANGGRTSYAKSPMESIKFWRNCRHHYNDKFVRVEDTLSTREIELKLEKTFGICGPVYTAICLFIINDGNSRPRFSTRHPAFWHKLTTIVGRSSKY